MIDRSGAQVLLVPNGQHHSLPWVELPRWQRVAENLTVAVRSEWGEEIVALFELPVKNDGPRYLAAEHLCTRCDSKMPTRWLSVSASGHNSLIDVRDTEAIEQALAICKGKIDQTPAGPFARLGWFFDLRNWMDSVIKPMGFHLTGEFRQLNASPTFSLIRFETDGPVLWFKAVGEPNQRELGVTCRLARLFPRHVPSVFATRAEWNGWITREAEGEVLCDCRGYTPWQRVAFDLAALQIDSREQAQDILEAGARDLTLGSLSEQIQPLADAAEQIMCRQIKTPPPILGHEQLLLLADRIRAAIDFLEPLAIPDALGHLDFNPGNAIVSASGCTFLDWAEAYIGNPFLTFQYLLEHFRRTGGKDSSKQSELTDTYVAPWLRMLSRERIDAALAVAPLLALFSYATATGMLTDKQRLEDAQFAGYARSLLRRMDREARDWADRGGRCNTQVTVSRP